MVGSHKILTVSYGTFSCTLEGFDDAFGTMKAIAEYFRDLSGDDRYFGAEPATPDAEMLQRIAEREVSRRVQARVGTEGIVLRAGAALPPVLAPPVVDVVEARAPSEAIAEDAPAMPPAARPPEAPAARARAVPAPPPARPAEAPDEVGVAVRLQRIRDVVGRAATGAARPLPVEDEDAPEIPAAAWPEPVEAAPAARPRVVRMRRGASEQAVADGAFEEPAPEPAPLLEPAVEADLLAALAAIEAVDHGEEAPEAASPEPASLAAEPVVEAAETDLPEAEPEDAEAVGARVGDFLAALRRDEAEAPGAPEASPQPAPETAAETEPEPAPAPDEPRARHAALESAPDGDEAAMARMISRADSQLADPDAARRRDAMAALKAAVAATEAARRLGEDPAPAAREEGRAAFRDDLREAVRPRRPVLPPNGGARPERPRPAPLKLVASQRVDVGPEAGPVPDASADAPPAAIGRLIRPRRVTVTPEANREAGPAPVVEPVAAPDPALAVAPAPAPESGIEAEPAVEAVAAPPPVAEPVAEPIPTPAPPPAPAGPARAAFAAFAAAMGARTLADTLEAAAAHLLFVDGHPDVSRPQVIGLARSATPGGLSREDGLECFGALLRQGRIVRVATGRFRVASDTRFDPARHAG